MKLEAENLVTEKLSLEGNQKYTSLNRSNIIFVLINLTTIFATVIYCLPLNGCT